MAKYIAVFNDRTFYSFGIGRHATAAIKVEDQEFRPCTDRGNGWVPRDTIDFLDMVIILAKEFDIDLNEPVH